MVSVRATYRTVWSSSAKTLYILPAFIVNWGTDAHNGKFIHFRFLVFWFCIGFFKKTKNVTQLKPKDIAPPPRQKTLTEIIFSDQNDRQNT